jgi:hypothetical protein
MATSSYFNNYNARYNEQSLVEDLITESIKIMGFDAFYLPNNNSQARDLIYGEDPVKKFETAFPVEMYLSSANEYMGEREMFTKFGLEIRNQVTVIVSKRAFTQRVPANSSMTRPNEGDLIYIPFLNGTGELYEIKFTNQTKDFFMLGRKVPYYYELELEKFKYSQEVIATGVAEIDSVVTDSAYTLHLSTGSGTGTYTLSEQVYYSSDNTYANATAFATVQSWIPSSNTLSVSNISGEFVDGGYILGYTSGAAYLLNTFDPLNAPANKESYDNSVTQTTAAPYINTSEFNAIGGL